MRARRSRGGFTLLEVLTAVTTVSVLLAVATYAYSEYRERAHRRLCHSQQRTLQKQIESLGAVPLDVPMSDIFAQLVQAGTLTAAASAPGAAVTVNLQDPGYGPGSADHYHIMLGSRMVGCYVHESPFVEP